MTFTGAQDFTPCDEKCPAVTGQPYNRVRYCPMAESFRHDRWKNWWRSLPEGQKLSPPNHPDETDCCLNFQCCSEVFAEQGLGNLREMLIEGYPVIHLNQAADPESLA